MSELPEFGWYGLSRKCRWLRYAAAKGFAARVLRCDRCGTEERCSLKDGVTKAASAERRFVKVHRECKEPG